MLRILSWLHPRLIRDSSSNPSWTLTLAVPISIILTLWFIVGGIRIEVAGLTLTFATRSGSDYALAEGVWLGFLAQRGWRNKGTTTPAPTGQEG
jgi:hypothetical protein